MNKDNAFEIIEEMHHRFDYYDLNDIATCLDGRFSIKELRAIVFIMENKLSAEVAAKIEAKKRQY